MNAHWRNIFYYITIEFFGKYIINNIAWISRYPQISSFIFLYPGISIIDQTGRIILIGLVNFNMVPVKSVKSKISSKPHKPPAVFKNALNLIIWQTDSIIQSGKIKVLGIQTEGHADSNCQKDFFHKTGNHLIWTDKCIKLLCEMVIHLAKLSYGSLFNYIWSL